MREGWKYCKLGELCSYVGDGDWIESKDQSDSGIRLIQTGNVGNGIFKAKDDKPHYISEKTFNRLGCTEIFEGDCLISRLPDPIGRACIIPKLDCRMITAVDCTILRFEQSINSKFFIYYSRSCKYQKDIDNKTTGTTRKRISRKNLECIKIPVPPIEEQQRIVTELDLLSSIIEKQKAQLKELDTLAQSIFYDMFGDPIDNNKNWEIKSLGCISEKIANGYNAKLEDDTYKTEGIMYFRCQNVWRNRFDYSDLVYIDENTNKLMKSSSLKHNDLLITKIGRLYTENSSLGRVSLYEGEDDEANLSGNLCFIRLKKTVCPKFILYILISEQFRGYIRRTTVGGIDKRALSTKQIEQFPIILPPLSLQQQFADKIQSIESQKSAITKSIAETQKLFDYTMDKYFG